MPKFPLKQSQSGFTLLEIMLVIVVLGMVSVAVVMTLPNNLIAGDSAKWQAERFTSILQFAEDEALISGNEIGIEFTENGYQFAIYDRQNKRWMPIDVAEMQQRIELPETIAMEYNLANSVWEELTTNNNGRFIDDSSRVVIGEEAQQTLNPQVYVMSSGEVSPFSLIFSNSDSDSSDNSFTVEVSMNGEIEMSQAEP
ncbi:MAG: type II secretion system minor pseudopilin GspH [Psychromonas sp.]